MKKSIWKTWHKVVLASVLGLFVLLFLLVGKAKDNYKSSLTLEQKDSLAKDERKSIAIGHFDEACDNVRRAPDKVVDYLRTTLKDPWSMEAIQSAYLPIDDTTFLFSFEYRSKNGFGGFVPGSINVLCDEYGNILEVKK